MKPESYHTLIMMCAKIGSKFIMLTFAMERITETA